MAAGKVLAMRRAKKKKGLRKSMKETGDQLQSERRRNQKKKAKKQEKSEG